MMIYIYTVIAIAICVAVLTRPFDFLSFGALTYVLYTINCAFGQTWITGGRSGFYYNSVISNATYILVIIQMCVILIYLYKEKMGIQFTLGKSGSKSDDEDNGEINFEMFWNLLLSFSVLVILYNLIFNIGISNFFSYARKSTLLENVSGLFSFGVWGIVISFLHAVQISDKKKAILSFGMVLILLVLGSRSYFVTIIIGSIVIKNGRIRSTLRQNIKTILLGAFIVLFLLVFKNIYQDLRALNFAAIPKDIIESAIWTGASDIGEFRTVFSIYDYVASSGFSLPITDTIARIVSIVPIINNFIPTSYPVRLSSIMKASLSSSYGLGGNFWAESIAMGGGVFLVAITIIWLILLKKSNKYVLVTTREKSVFVITAASYCSFYIHRLDWVQVLGCLKSVLVFYILYFILENISARRGY